MKCKQANKQNPLPISLMRVQMQKSLTKYWQIELSNIEIEYYTMTRRGFYPDKAKLVYV